MAKKHEVDFMGSEEKTTKTKRGRPAGSTNKTSTKRMTKRPASIRDGSHTKITMPTEMAAAYTMGYAAGQWDAQH